MIEETFSKELREMETFLYINSYFYIRPCGDTEVGDERYGSERRSRGRNC